MGAIYRDYDRRTHKKCIKCRAWKPRVDIIEEGMDGGGEVREKHAFGQHKDSSDGLQSICFSCKNIMNNKARQKNVTARIRHHTATRCLTQLGKPLTPKNFVTNLEDYLGYRISALVKHLSSDLKKREGRGRKLRDALNEGYHIDHIRPLSRYVVIRTQDLRDKIGKEYGEVGTVDWDQFRDCWRIDNLTAIPALENLQKGAKVVETKVPVKKVKAPPASDTQVPPTSLATKEKS